MQRSGQLSGCGAAAQLDDLAAELLADRRARGPVKRTAKKTTRKAPAKKATKR